MPPEPVIKKFSNVECRDAVLAYDGTEPVIDADGKPVTNWDGRTFKIHPVTGEQVPDEGAQVQELRYLNPRIAAWPEADYVVGNPPFIGASTMRRALGDGYVDSLRKAWKDVPDSTDFVMYWWQHAAELTRKGKLLRFGFITTNSLRQAFNRRILHQQLTAKPALSLSFAIPDHPWVDSADGAAVRIAMTVGKPAIEGDEGIQATVVEEREGAGEGLSVELLTRKGVLHADLSVGANVVSAKTLRANERLSYPGIEPHGAGFVVSLEQGEKLDGGNLLRFYRNRRDLTDKPRGVMVIDAFGIEENELRLRYPATWQWLNDRVKPERDQNPRESRRKNWWLFGESCPKYRAALPPLRRYIATVKTAKHRLFQFLDSNILPDSKLIAITLEDSFFLGILSSRIHMVWAVASGSTLEDRPTYVKSASFEQFPFPAASDEQMQKIRAIAEELDSHRKRQQELHSGLGLTDMYNVLTKLRAGETLTAKEKTIHEQGLVSVLRQLHDDLDAAVADAYGWPANLTDEEILERLVTLNAERAREEAQGLVRWLRPEYQKPQGEQPAVQARMELREEEVATPVTSLKAKTPWPKTLPEQVQAVRTALVAAAGPVTAEAIARTFLRARTDKIGELLATLAALGQARETEPGSYSA